MLFTLDQNTFNDSEQNISNFCNIYKKKHLTRSIRCQNINPKGFNIKKQERTGPNTLQNRNVHF